MRRVSTHRSPRGVALFVATLAILVIGAFCAAGVLFAIGRDREVQLEVGRYRALGVAEDGVTRTLAEMNRRARAEGPLQLSDGMEFAEDLGYGRYALVLHAAEDDAWRLASVGTVDAAGRGAVSRTVEVVALPVHGDKPQNRFGYAFFSDEALSLNGLGFTDSYDSREGVYAPSAAAPPYSQPYDGSHGDIGSNDNVEAMAGGSELHGTVSPGPGHSAEVGGLVEGEVAPLDRPFPMPPIPASDWQPIAADNDNDTIVTLGGGSAYNPSTQALDVSSRQTVQLGVAGGERRTYFFSSVSTQGAGVKIDVVGPTTIYLQGDWRNAGTGTINHAGEPPDLLIFGIGPGTMTINGASNWGAGIYAPLHRVTFNGAGEIRGACTAKSISRNGSWSLHYDEALGDLGGGGGDPEVVGFTRGPWLESSTSAR